MDNAFQLIWTGFNTVMTWVNTVNYQGITVFQVAVFGLLLSLIYRFGLSPIFGAGGGSLSISASDVVSKIKRSNNSDKH